MTKQQIEIIPFKWVIYILYVCYHTYLYLIILKHHMTSRQFFFIYFLVDLIHYLVVSNIHCIYSRTKILSIYSIGFQYFKFHHSNIFNIQSYRSKYVSELNGKRQISRKSDFTKALYFLVAFWALSKLTLAPCYHIHYFLFSSWLFCFYMQTLLNV